MFDRIDKGMWWDRALSLVEGCTPVSAGCKHCWAAQQTYMRSHQKNPAISYRYSGLSKDKTTFNGNIRLMYENLSLPLRTRKPTVWAVWNDFFHPLVPLTFIERVWATMMGADHHIYVILTKRPERILEAAKYFCWTEVPHVWHGVSVEDQKTVDLRIAELLKVPAAVIVVSYEPALGSLILPPEFLERGKRAWLICGGETGPGARPMNPEWARQVRDQCVAAGVPYFHKQNGVWIPVDTVGDDPDPKGRSAMAYKDGTVDLDWQAGPKCVGAQVLWRVTKKQAGRLLDGKEYNEMPEV